MEISTKAEIDRCPDRSRRSFIQAGVGAVGFNPRMTRPVKRPHSSGALICTGLTHEHVGGTAVISGIVSVAPVTARKSRPTPITESASPRLGVNLISMRFSSKRSALRISSPIGASSFKTQRPEWSSEIPSSRAEQSMPKLSTPRILAFLMVKPPGKTAPILAHGTLMPALALGAPQTICSGDACPTSTVHTCRWSEFSWLTHVKIFPTTTPVKGGAIVVICSTSRPAMVRVSVNSSLVKSGLM